MKRLALLATILIVLSMLLSACSQQAPEVVEKEVTSIVVETVKETVIVEGEAQVVEKEVTRVVEVTVEAKEFSFTPSKLTVDVGTKVRLTLENGGSVSHDFVVDELDVEMTLVSPGQSQTIEFTLERAGIYEFDCSIPGHEEAGMTGTLTVK